MMTPRAFKCPITQQTFRQPILEADGHTYEKAALDQWDLHSKGLSPLTREPLPNLPRTPNTTLARALADFREHQSATGPQRDEWKRHTESAISYEPFTLPVHLSDGHDYNGNEALQVIAATGRSPFAQVSFGDREFLHPNRALQALSAELHGFTTPAYPAVVVQVYRLLPAMPAAINPPGEGVLEVLHDYWNGALRRGEALDHPEARRFLIYDLKRHIAIAALSLSASIDEIVKKERRVFGLPFFLEGASIWNLRLPTPVQRLVNSADDELVYLQGAADVLALNGDEDRTTQRFIQAGQDFLSPRESLELPSAQAGLRGAIAGLAMTGAVYGLGLMHGSPYRSLAMQAASQAVTLGVFLAERTILLASTKRPRSLHDARASQDMPQDTAQPLSNWAWAAAGAITRAASTAGIAAGAGAVAGFVTPVGWISSDLEHHYSQTASFSAITAAALVSVYHVGRMTRALLRDVTPTPLGGWV